MIDYSKVRVSHRILCAEREGEDDVPDLRDVTLTVRLIGDTEYDAYIETVREAVKKVYGKRFIMYGAVSDLHFGLWRDGEALAPINMSFNKADVKQAKKAVPLEGKKFIIFQTYVELPWIVMRGYGPEELVVDTTHVSYHTLAVIG